MFTEFFAIAGIHLLAVMSPGPDTAIVLNNAIRFGRRAGVYTAAGIATGIIVHVLYSVAGVGYLLHHHPWLQQAMMLLAALYLGYIGIKGFLPRASAEQPDIDGTKVQLKTSQPYINGLITNGLNPKATLFFIALFTAVVSETTTFAVKIGYGVYLVLATFAWFAVLSMVVGHPRLQKRMQSSYQAINLIMSSLLVLISIRIMWTLFTELL